MLRRFYNLLVLACIFIGVHFRLQAAWLLDQWTYLSVNSRFSCLRCMRARARETTLHDSPDFYCYFLHICFYFSVFLFYNF